VQNRFSLPPELTIYTIGDLQPQWLAWVHDGGSDDVPVIEEILRVDAAAVDEVDSAGVQLLLSLANALAAQQRCLWLVDPSEPLTKACAALGVAALLESADGAGAQQ
jgi:ABC-type transporter Mla MlaB component